jgi:acyl-CoA thioesterase FadM
VQSLRLGVSLHVLFDGVHELRIATRWNDFDALGHLNHAVYHVFCDEARDAALRATVGGFDAWPNVVVHAEVDYRREIPLGTREVVVLTRIASVGRSSVRFEHDVADGAAQLVAVLVAWDPATRRSREITPAERDALTDSRVVPS